MKLLSELYWQDESKNLGDRTLLIDTTCLVSVVGLLFWVEAESFEQSHHQRVELGRFGW